MTTLATVRTFHGRSSYFLLILSSFLCFGSLEGLLHGRPQIFGNPSKFSQAMPGPGDGIVMDVQTRQRVDYPAQRSCAGHITNHSCVPTGQEIDSNLANRSESVATTRVGDRFRFYLHDKFSAGFALALQCYLKYIGTKYGVDDLDAHVPPNYAEHLTDYWSLQRFSQHPQRTFDEQEASLHVIGVPAFTSFLASDLPDGRCGTKEEHYQRMEKAAKEIKKLDSFKLAKPSSFLILDSYFREAEIFGKSFTKLLAKGRRLVLATVDYGEGWSPKFQIKTASRLIVPYKAHYVVENAAWQNAEGQKNIDFMFHGNMHRRNEGQYRDGLFTELAAHLKSSSIHDAKFKHVEPEKQGKFTYKTATIAKRSRFCLIPEGDTPSTRRLFDALAAGCIPIIFARIQEISQHLPFRKSIDWSQTAVFAGDIACNAKHAANTTIEFLEGLLHDPGWERTMRERGQAVFRNTLSFSRGHGLVTAILAEMDQQASKSY